MRDRVFLICRTLLSLNQINVAWLMGPSRNDFEYGVYGGEIPEWAIDLRNPWNNKTFIGFVNALMTPDIVNNPNYLRINGKPVLYIWDEGAFFNQEETYIAVKRLIAERTGSEAYIIADWIPRIPTQPSDEYVQFLLEKFRGAGLRVVDAFTGWVGLHRVGLDTREYVDNYEYYYDIQLNTWRNFTKTWGKDFIVTLTPSFDNSYSWGGPQIPLPRDINKFAERLKIAIRYLDNTHPVLKIDTWNDFGEWTYIEPTRKDGFTYLEILRSILVNLTTDKTPPSVTSFNWTPTRMVLDKIYDIIVNFTAIDDENPIAYAELRFIPVEYHFMIEKYGMRPEDYLKVFPPDKERVFVLTPVDGKFDSLEEKFSVPIKDIVGGREYKIVALVRDLAGNEKIVEVKTPYIRQFENFGKELYDKGIIVAAHYYNWYTPGYDIPKDLPDKPLLGLYYSDDNVVFNKHVDWATGHGINVFIFPYPYHNPKVAFTWLERTFKKNMEADLFNQIKFSFCSTFVDEMGRPPYNFDNPEVKEAFVKAIKDLISDYASLPNYWRIDGKPTIVLWGTPDRFVSNQRNIEAAIKEVREFSKSKLGVDLYIISDDINIFNTREAFNSSDAIYHYSPFLNDKTIPNTSIKENVQYTIDWMKRLEEISKNWGKIFIPTVAPGFDNTYDYRNTQKAPIIYKDPEGFRLYIKEVIKNFKPKILFVTSFNEWFEGTQIEPAESYGIIYLEILKEILKEELKNR
jgi:hypothetical protein